MVITLRYLNAKKSSDMTSQNFPGINFKLCHFIVDDQSQFISLQFWSTPTIGCDIYVFSGTE